MGTFSAKLVTHPQNAETSSRMCSLSGRRSCPSAPRKAGLGGHFMTAKKSVLSSASARVRLSPKSQCESPASIRLGPCIQKDWKPWLWEKRLWTSRCQQHSPCGDNCLSQPATATNTIHGHHQGQLYKVSTAETGWGRPSRVRAGHFPQGS